MASFQEQTISQGELLGNQASIDELLRSNYDLAVYVAYYWASQKQKETKQQVSLNFSFPEPELGLTKLLTLSQIQLNPKVSVQFQSIKSDEIQAKVDSKLYTESEIALGSLEFAKNRFKLLQLRTQLIEDIIIKKHLIALAQKQNLTLNEFIEKNVFSSQEISDSQIKELALKNNIPVSKIDESTKVRLKKIIKSKYESQKLKDFIAKDLKDTEIKLAFPPVAKKVYPLPLPGRLPSMGTGSLKVTLLSNFLCLKCRESEKQIIELVKKYQNSVKLYYLFQFKEDNFRIRMVAEASYCVRDQGEDNFWEFQTKALAASFDGQEELINKIVIDLKLDSEKFKKCFISRKYKDEVEKHRLLVQSFGPTSLPTILVDNYFYESPISLDLVEEKIKILK